jgi:hypothetical protein
MFTQTNKKIRKNHKQKNIPLIRGIIFYLVKVFIKKITEPKSIQIDRFWFGLIF